MFNEAPDLCDRELIHSKSDRIFSNRKPINPAGDLIYRTSDLVRSTREPVTGTREQETETSKQILGKSEVIGGASVDPRRILSRISGWDVRTHAGTSGV